MGQPLTDKQRKVLPFLREFTRSRSFALTAREVAARFGIAEKNAFYYMELLERKGYIRRHRNSPRRIEFLGKAALSVPRRVPVLGQVPAGNPREAIELAEEEILLDPSLAGEGEIFSLRVDGDSREISGGGGDRSGFVRHLVRAADPRLLLRQEGDGWSVTLRRGAESAREGDG